MQLQPKQWISTQPRQFGTWRVKQDSKQGTFPLHPLCGWVREQRKSLESNTWKIFRWVFRLYLSWPMRSPPLTTLQLEPGDQQLVRRLFTRFISGTLPTEVHNTASALRFEKTGCPSEEATMWYKQHSNQPGVEKLTGAAGAPVLPVNPQPCSRSTSTVETAAWLLPTSVSTPKTLPTGDTHPWLAGWGLLGVFCEQIQH